MNTQDFQYDIAFSFVAQDEDIATRLADEFEGRLRVFLYSRKQEKIAGTDGESAFNAVFASQSRLVVVLYREGWGQSRWTRIEETAIRNRAFDEGYDFVLFIPLDDKPVVPRWLPRHRLWIGLQRWGLKCAASVIDARFQEVGGEPREAGLEDHAARAERKVAFERERRKFLKSDTGLQLANQAYEVLRQEILAAIPSLVAKAPSLGISVKDKGFQIAVLASKPALLVAWRPRFMNTLEDSELEVSMWEGHPPFPDIRHWEQPTSIEELIFHADLATSGNAAWSTGSPSGPIILESKAAAEYILKWWINRALAYEA